MDFLITLTLILDSAVRLSVPLLLACLAGLYSERSGVVDIGLEGKMLAGAFAAGTVAALTGSAWLGMGMAIVVSIFFALIHGYASITQRGNQIVSGVAINFVAAGLTALLGQAWFSMGGKTPQLQREARFNSIDLPFAESLKDVPVIGQLYSELMSGHNLLVYVAVVAVAVTWWILFRTRFGLRLRAVGENPGAVDTAGISVAWLRYRAVMITGALCGLAGTYLAIAQSAGFSKDMTAGRGFIALAALIFAKWKPVNALGACFLFGFLDAVAIRMQGASLPLVGQVPVQFMQALPYILTVILLAGFIGKAIPPKASGTPYTKER
ncbi:ABC transporter permease [Cohaesibacter intestini]|uniref:ABC transporter permease n=1 Tax=Cohaesibacter intestini TaxID=2211145 RepID=UPI000DE8C052|nr:ABC transporter permease [Cohaesibacter intestini]